MSAAPLPSHVSNQDTHDLIAAGTVSMVYALNNDWLRFVRLIAQCRAITDDGLELERGDCLRQVLRGGLKTVESHTRLQWALEAAEGLHYIHEKGIIHADVGCHNLLVHRSGHIKFIDFAGSGVDGNEPLVCYEWCSYRPGTTTLGIKTDIFAFGSALFEIESGNVPFHQLQEVLGPWELMREVEKRFAAKDYPDMEMLQLKHVITRCWNDEYESMADVRDDIAAYWQR
ncbi:kinase-like protein [Penicillium hispanicum]|uniref:kinase-like protein n=1 Tax=Penicillium hispanicum TaxID=1080232 RepID=UPI002540A88E|nr:kinase-like protein [Penicillium hispanicum]KAJ5585261.1 kinase-like protein [Penicillium hispanicum]